MKKITMWLFLLIGLLSYSQINISQDFPTTTTPTGWGLGGGSLTTTQPCATASWRFNVYSGSSTTINTLSSETFVSTGEQLNVSFDYKIVDWSAATVATTPYNGTIVVETSSDNGTTYGNAVVVVNNGNHTVANTCATKSVIIPGSNVPGGANTKIRIKCNFGTSGDYYVYLDNIVITQAAAPACTGTPAPGNTIFPSPICAGGSATLSLQNYTPGDGVTYQWYKDAVAISGAISLTYVIPSVTTTNSYYCEVTCAGNTTASSTVVVGPTILTAPTTVEPFATFLPTCWLFGDNGDLATGPATYGANGWKNDGFANSGLTGSIAYNHYTTGANDWIVSPVINIPAAGYELKFDASLTQWNGTGAPTTPWDAGDVVEVLVSTTGLDNWTLIYTIDNANPPAAAGSSIAVDLDAYATQNIRIAYRVVSGAIDSADDTDIFIDNFQIRLSPTCPDQTGLTVGNITSSGADTSWDDLSGNGSVGYEYAVTTSATPPASGITTTATFYVASGLAPQTVYYLHVRSECAGSTYGNWSTLSFTTNCASVTSFIQNFDAVTTPNFPNCWAKIGAGGTANTQTGSPNSAPNTMYLASFSTASLAVVATQQVSNLGAGTNRIKFDMRGNFGVGAVVEFGYLTNALDANTFVALTTFTASNLTYTTYQYSPPAGTYSDYPAFRHTGTVGNSVLIDNVIWELNPTCPDQTGLTVGNITSSGADTSWDDLSGSGVSGYEYAVTTSATPPVSGTPTTLTFNVASGLAPQTVHYLHVRTDCGAGSYGVWVSIPFTTQCAPITTLPWIENFETVTTPAIPQCWSEESGDWDTSNSTTYNTAHSGTKYLRDAWDATDEFMWTPAFNLIAGTSYDFSSWIQGDGDDTWTVDFYVNNTQNSTGATQLGGQYVVPGAGPIAIQSYAQVIRSFVPATSGTYYFAFRVNEPSGDPWYIAFDDVELKLSPACPAPSASSGSVTDVSANLTWAAVPSATLGYEYVLDNVPTDPAVAGISTMALAYSATGLTQSTTYYFHIRSVCSAGTYSTWSTISFTTLATPPANDNLCNATVLTIGTPTGLTNTLVGATSQTSEPVPACFSGGINGSIWFAFVAPASGSVEITTDFAGGTLEDGDTEVAVYAANGVTCSDLTTLGTSLGCDQDGGTTVNYSSFLSLTGLTTGNTYYIQVDKYSGVVSGTFGIQVTEVLSSNSFDTTSFVAYPNPVKDMLNLSYKAAISNVRVVNLLGQEVLNAKTNSNDVQVNMSALTAGAYIVNITVEDTVHTIKVIKE